MTLGKQIKYARQARGLTQKELSQELGISLRTLQHYEYDDTKPKLATLIALSQLLNCDIGKTGDVQEENVSLDLEDLKKINLENFTVRLNIMLNESQRLTKSIKDLLEFMEELNGEK